MLQVSSVYLHNDSLLSQPDGMCIVVAVATGRRSMLHHKTIKPMCVVHEQHVNSFAARHVASWLVTLFKRQVVSLPDSGREASLLTLEARTG